MINTTKDNKLVRFNILNPFTFLFHNRGVQGTGRLVPVMGVIIGAAEKYVQMASPWEITAHLDYTPLGP